MVALDWAGADVQDVAAATDPAHRRIAHGGLPDRGMRLLVGPGSGTRAGHVVVAAVVGHLIVAPQSTHQAQGFGAAGAALGHPRAEGFALLRAVAQPDAQDETPLRDVVQCRHLLGDFHRVQQRQQQD